MLQGCGAGKKSLMRKENISKRLHDDLICI
jgi:hypothetical protein